MRRRARNAAAILIAAIFVSGSVCLFAAPYLPRLIAEGYPKLVWDGAGEFALVAENARPAALPRTERLSQLTPELKTAFDEKGGKALLIWKSGRIVSEHYGPGISPNTLLNSFSMVKSLVGALVFKAMAEGKLEGLDTPIGAILPEIKDEALARVPVRALLKMRSGVAFETDMRKGSDARTLKAVEESQFNPFGPMARLHMLGLDAILATLAADDEAKGTFAYQNVNTALLGAGLESLYQRPLPELLEEKIWMPAGAGSAYWRKPNRDAPVSAYCCLFATPSAWIRVGLYVSRNGTQESPFLPVPLWRAFLGLDVSPAGRQRGHYGFHILQDVLDRAGEPLQGGFSYMMGSGGQVLYLVPGRDFIVVRFGEQMQLLHTTLY